MKPARSTSPLCPGILRSLAASSLSAILLVQPVFAAEGSSRKSAAAKPVQIQGQERTLHALNRLTFGPTPGQVASVQKQGLSRWFEQQLNPSSIEDAALDLRLANFPAMKLPQALLFQRFPSPQMLKAAEVQGLPLPTDPVQHAIYVDQLAFYKLAQEKKAAKNSGDAGVMKPGMAASGPQTAQTDQTAADVALPGDLMDPANPSMASHEAQLYSGLDAVKVVNLPPDQRMARILAMSPQELIAFRSGLTPRELAEVAQGLTPEQKETILSLSGSQRVVAGELLQARLIRDVYTNRQLEAVMTDFWLNHFNIYLRKNQNEPYLLPSFEREVIRPNAMGKFEDLLVATAKSPAMLMYLDNWQSIGPDSLAAERIARQRDRNPNAKQKAASGLNENYARELMELHTLGVNGGYTQTDVTQLAKVFTGWTVEKPRDGAAYYFEPNRHEPGTKHVLGAEIRGGGEAEGLQVLHMLATSPSTAKFISTKLAVRFVSDDPPPALVDRMSRSFLSSGGDMKAVLRTMFNAPEFWAPSVNRAKVKTPLEFVVSAVRATNAQILNAQPLVQSLSKLDMPLYGMQTPNGYSWKAEPWVSTGALVGRMNFSLLLAGDRIQGVSTGLTQLLNSPEAGVHPAAFPVDGADEIALRKEQRLETLLLGQSVSEHTRATVLQQLQVSTAQQQAEKDFPIKAGDPEQMATSLPGGRLYPPFETPAGAPLPLDRQAGVMAGLLLGSPEFQRR